MINIDHYVRHRSCQATIVITLHVAFIGDANAGSVPVQHRDSMPENRNQKPSSWIADAKAASQKALAKSRELLKEPPADTFLGRQHRDMIPLPEQEE